jgi:hypothetical protein
MRLHGDTVLSGYPDHEPCPFGGAAGDCYVCDTLAEGGALAMSRFMIFVWMESMVIDGSDFDRWLSVFCALGRGLFKWSWP